MCRFLSRKFSTIAVAILLSLSVLVGFPDHAEAVKPLKSIAFDPGVTAVNVATIYETAPTTQKTTMKSLKGANKSLKKAAGFEGAAVLQSDDGTRLIFLSQWKDLESYQTAIATPTESSKETKTTALSPTRTVVFELGKTQTAREGMIPAVKGKEAVVEFSEFKLKTPDDQEKVVANAEKLIPAALLKQPTPQSVVLMSSTDNTDVALMANWNCTADFAEGETPAGFDALDAEVASLVDVEQHLYNVVSILPAEEKKPKKETEES
ncbi:antibiotic biosynthesis monooxygenase [Leptolyngbya sp. AN03gr2]|uniref:antibiotic biosynthesis monooxygenase n=1 Tax=unclassified Leptolyngbya TaxID=2650499 RepID=UPI003D3188D5